MKYLVPDDALVAVLQKANEALGAEFYKTPRDVVRSFVGLLSVLDQNPNKTWRDFVGGNFMQKPAGPTSVEEEVACGVVPDDEPDSDLTTLKL